MGEREFVLVGATTVAQGAYGEWMTKQITEERLRLVAEGDQGLEAPGWKLREWAKGATTTDLKIRTATVRSLNREGGASWRFWARAGL